MKVTLLGTATPAPSLKRASSGYLIEMKQIFNDTIIWGEDLMEIRS